MKKRNIIIILLLLPYLPICFWLSWRYIAIENRERQYQRQHQKEMQWVAQFRRVSPEIQDFYLTMPRLQEAWARTPQKQVFRYFLFSRVSDDLMVNVAQTFEFTSKGLRPLGNPTYYRENILDDYDGFYGHTLKTVSIALTPTEVRALSRKYHVVGPGHSKHVKLDHLQGSPAGWVK